MNARRLGRGPKRSLHRGLRRVVGANAVLDDPGSLAAYSYDSSLQSASPDLVVFPRTTEHVAQIVRLLAAARVPYVARGAGTNLSGGSIPLQGGAVIALAGMNKILDIDTENLYARVEPGLTNLALQEALAPRGFFYAPDPASQKVSTLGGNFAENSGGPHCLKYGVTTNHILGATLVTPEGDVVELGGETLEGPDSGLLGLLVGSEGTLGIATEIVCRIMPLPEAVRTMLAVFDSVEQAGRAVSDIIADGVLPATLEMMDNMVIRAVEQSLKAGYPTDAAAVLIIEIDGPREGLDETAAEIEKICGRNDAREVRAARDEAERAQLWAGRRGAFGAVARLHPNYMVSDGTVPRTRLPDVLRSVAEIGRRYDLEIGNVFHAGDGNLHPLLFFDSRDAAQVERVHRAGEEILAACVEAGGTITGEHGVGIEKIEAMSSFFGPAEIDLMRRIKTALDPAGLCNPGKILPPGTDDRLETKTKSRRTPSDDGHASGPLKFSPRTPQGLAAVVGKLRDEGKSFAPVGANTLFSRLPQRQGPDALIDTTKMRAIVEHDAANLTVTAQAGLTIGELQETLAAAGQFLPLDAPAPATLGGAVASALAGPRRHAHGAARDLALGLTFIGGDARAYRAGGKTVKNVAGYDFGKLLIGSWGTLGIITEITFRALPLPKACGAILAGFDLAKDARGAATECVGSRLNPAIATLLNANAAALVADRVNVTTPSPARFTLALGAEGSAASVERQLAEFERICRKHGVGNISAPDRIVYETLLAALIDISHAPVRPDPSLSLLVTCRCGDAADVVDEMGRLSNGADSWVVAHVAAGSVYARFGATGDGGSAKRIVDALVERFPRASLVVFGTGNDARDDFPFITGNRESVSLRKAIKESFDPQGLLNPGMPEW